ncbi:hypothetical protein AAF712_010438 [Marasmius tenuissimus]|uniref:Uncharacterized protein n=1 Tax=Marasmius tenuissimus TaxID=585030 RepID=A0ABR2ZLW9_9AGAR
MARPKLYHTDEERREAKKSKDKRHYDRKREEILHSKKVKRARDLKAMEKQEIHARKLRRENISKGKRQGSSHAQEAEDYSENETRALIEAREPSPSVPVARASSESPDDVEMTICGYEDNLEAMKNTFMREIGHCPRAFLEGLAQHCVRWMQSTWLLPRSQREAAKSPAFSALQRVYAKACDVQEMGNDCCYLARTSNRPRERWDNRIKEFSIFTHTLDEMVNVLNAMDDALNRLGQNVKEKDLKQIYHRTYPLHL